MTNQIQPQLQLDQMAAWAQQCDPKLALLRWQQLAARVRETKKAA